MLNKKVLWCILALGLLLLLTPVVANSREQTGPLIRLQAATFDPVTDDDPIAGPGIQAAEAGESYYIVQFNGPVEAVWGQQLEQLGIELLGYIPDNTHIARMQPKDVEKASSMYAVRWVGPYRPEYKLSPALANEMGAAADDKVEVFVVAFPGESLADLSTFLRKLGGTIIQSTDAELGVSIRVQIPPGVLPAITENPAVNWIEPYIPPQLANSAGRKVMNVESVWQSHGLFGSGQIVAVSDSGLSVEGALNADFAGRVIQTYAPSQLVSSCTKNTVTDLHGHGTHVAGSILGNGTNSGSNSASHQYNNSHAGAAPEAQMIFMALEDPNVGFCVSPNGEFIAKGYEGGARISSNSWGTKDNGLYSLTSQTVDYYTWNHKDYLVIYAAHNYGPNPGTVASPSTAKNVLTVGASENDRPSLGQSNGDNPGEMASFSGRGPTQDGRVKPDVVAPGTWILSVKAAQAPSGNFWGPYDSNYAYMGGTSMATPLTAGATTLVREWLGKVRGMANPSAALLKALMIHGALPLPGASTPNNDSGWGRVDLKNTLGAQYTIFDDHIQGLSTGQSVTYTVQVVGTTSLGALFAGDHHGLDPSGLAADSTDTLALAQANTAIGPIEAVTAAAGLRLEPVPGFDAPLDMQPIPSGTDSSKQGLAPLSNPVPSIASPAGLPENNGATFAPFDDSGGPTPSSFLQNIVGGGDFEDPDWTNYWQYVWLGSGVPERTATYVINGFYSMWLGGTASDDSIWYPIAFPDTIASDFNSVLQFNLVIADQDIGYDKFCVALTDTAGAVIALNDPSSDCADTDGGYSYSHAFTPAEKNALAGQTGYLVLYTAGDGADPHMSAFVDDIVLAIDFPDVTLTSTPSTGPAGTTFLLTGQYNVPYGAINVCLDSCSTPDNVLGTVYADARGDLAAYLPSSTSDPPGPYNIQTSDAYGYGRTATTTITIAGASSPSLAALPASGPAGTKFAISGSDFLPGDTNIAVSVNTNALGTVSSDSSGSFTLTIQTSSNTPASTYNVEATDSASRTATTSFDVTAVPGGNPTMVVSPASGPPGTSFTFNGSSFSTSSDVTFSLDGQAVGQVSTDAAGNFQVTLNTTSTVPPGTYTLQAEQGSKRASAQFEITGDGGGGQTGGGLYLTLVWTDPPAQLQAASDLVNDLDLRVVGPGGTYYGNGGASVDRKNNVETIRLENPTVGTYTIYVEAHSVNTTFGTQPYALVGTTAQSFGASPGSVDVTGRKFWIYLPLVLKN